MDDKERSHNPRRRFLKLALCATAAGVLNRFSLHATAKAAETSPQFTGKSEAIRREIQQLRDTKHSCSQATFTGICKAVGSELTEEQLLSLSAGFAGGIGKTFDDGSCGALVGGVMAIGWYLRGDTDASVALSKKLFEDFKAHEGTVVCKDILEKYEGFANCTNCCLYVGKAVSESLG